MNSPKKRKLISKWLVLNVIVTLLTISWMSSTAFGSSSIIKNQTITGVDCKVNLRSDGSAEVVEEWRVTFNTPGENTFERILNKGGDIFESIAGISEISVYADDELCSAYTPGTSAAYSCEYISSDENYNTKLHVQSNEKEHVFVLRYTEAGAVKLYNGSAYYCYDLTDARYGIVCENVTVKINAPKTCFPEEFNVENSGSLACETGNGAMTFNSANTSGDVKIRFSMPASMYDSEYLSVIADDYTQVKIVSGTTGVILFVAMVLLIIYLANFKKMFIKRMDRKCNKNAIKESSYDEQYSAARKLGIAKTVWVTLPELTHKADLFIIMSLDLAARGYIRTDIDSFDVNYSETNDPEKKLTRTEKHVLEFYDNRFKFMIANPVKFHNYIKKFNSKIHYVSPLDELSSSRRKILTECFEIKHASIAHEYICPQEISDDIFGICKYTSYDLLVSIMKENSLVADGSYEEPDTDKYKHNLFILRDVYNKGLRMIKREKRMKLREKKVKK